ncbi:MAG: MBL fold metallo-hydrolase [Armatimonadota bacterium]
MSTNLSIERVLEPEWDQNCYVVSDETGEAVVIDPGFQWEAVVSLIGERGLTVVAILNTHGHLDHIAGNRGVQQACGAAILTHRADCHMLIDPQANFSLLLLGQPIVSPPAAEHLEEGTAVQAGRFSLVPLHTPGHSPGGVSLVLEANGAKHGVFTGDTLFAGSVGRTDFPGASYDELIASIRLKLMGLADDLKVYPGHGPMTTIGAERRHNPFLS